MTDEQYIAVPTFDRRAEVEALLAQDTSVLGHLWVYEQQGLTPQEMAEREGTATTGWVRNYRILSACSATAKFQRRQVWRQPPLGGSARG